MQKIKPITNEKWILCNEFNRKMRDDFLENSTELSEKTLKAYESNLRIWFNWVRENCDNKRQVDIKPRDYLKFQNWLINLKHSSADVSNKRSAISSLNNYIVVYYSDEYPTFHNFINKGIKKPEKSFKNEKIPPSTEEMNMIIKTLEESNNKNKWQLIAYLKFTWETGCRRAESMQVLKSIVDTKPIVKTVKTKDEDGNEIEKEAKYYLSPKIRCKGKGKTGNVRQLKFSDYAMDALKKWIEDRGEDNCEYMFVTKWKGEIKQVSESTFNQWSTDTFSKLLGRRFHPHCLRESRATSIVVEDGKSIEAAQSLLGHASSETTKIYVIKDDDDSESDELFI